MTSSNNKYNESEVQEEPQTEEERYISECLSYMIDNYNRFNAGELQLVCAELHNGQIIICLTNIDEATILYMPVHLYETTSEIDGVYSPSYAFYPYQNLADEFGEIIIPEEPAIIFNPKQSIKDKYFEYWDRVKNILVKDLNLEENDILYTDSGTLLKS